MPVILICTSLTAKDVDQFLNFFQAIYLSSLRSLLPSSILYFQLGCLSSLCYFLKYFAYPRHKSLSDRYTTWILSPCGLPPHPAVSFLYCTEFFNFMSSHVVGCWPGFLHHENPIQKIVALELEEWLHS